MTTKQTSGLAAISSSLWPRTSVTKKIAPASRSGRASSGRARKPPENCVVSMPTLWLVEDVPDAVDVVLVGHGALSVTERERRAGVPEFRASALLANRRSVPICFRADRTWSDPWGWLSMIYILAVFVPPLALLLNGQLFAAIFNFMLIVPCLFFGLIFHVLLLVPSAHAIIAIYHNRENRKHREIVEAIREHGPPPGWRG